MNQSKENSPNNDDVPDRYKPTLAIWENLVRFWAGKPTIPLWAIASNFYYGVRTEYNKQLLEIIDGGGDAYTKINNLRKLIND
jgi:hypothetical protein